MANQPPEKETACDMLLSQAGLETKEVGKSQPPLTGSLPQVTEVAKTDPRFLDNDIEQLISHARRLADSDPDNDHLHWSLLWIFQGVDLDRRRRKLEETITDEA